MSNPTVLVTGGTGVLGRQIVQELTSQGVQVRLLSRQSRLASVSSGVTWVQGDLNTGANLASAFEGVEVVVHAASLPIKPMQDVNLTRNVIRAAQEAKVAHTLYVSIVGIERAAAYPYYRAKLASERLLATSGLPYSIQRATQFHEFVAFMLGQLHRLPVMPLPAGAALQPVAAVAVARQLAQVALDTPAGRREDIAGPEILSLPELVRSWQAATGHRKPVVPLPLLPAWRVAAGTALVNPQAQRLGQHWQDWLTAHAMQVNAYQTAPAPGGAQ